MSNWALPNNVLDIIKMKYKKITIIMFQLCVFGCSLLEKIIVV